MTTAIPPLTTYNLQTYKGLRGWINKNITHRAIKVQAPNGKKCFVSIKSILNSAIDPALSTKSKVIQSRTLRIKILELIEPVKGQRATIEDVQKHILSLRNLQITEKANQQKNVHDVINIYANKIEKLKNAHLEACRYDWKVLEQKLKPGDIICVKWKDGVFNPAVVGQELQACLIKKPKDREGHKFSHMAIYLGNGHVAEAVPSPRDNDEVRVLHLSDPRFGIHFDSPFSYVVTRCKDPSLAAQAAEAAQNIAAYCPNTAKAKQVHGSNHKYAYLDVLRVLYHSNHFKKYAQKRFIKQYEEYYKHTADNLPINTQSFFCSYFVTASYQIGEAALLFRHQRVDNSKTKQILSNVRLRYDAKWTSPQDFRNFIKRNPQLFEDKLIVYKPKNNSLTAPSHEQYVMEHQLLETVQENLATILAHADKSGYGLHVVKQYVAGSNVPQYLIKPCSKMQRIFSSSKRRIEKTETILKQNIALLEKRAPQDFSYPNQTHSPLFITAQKFNHLITHGQSKLLTHLHQTSPIHNPQFTELDALELLSITNNMMADIDSSQFPVTKGTKTKKHYYDKADAALSHSGEAFNIFTSTQWDRTKAKIQGKHPFFRHNEHLTPEKIYAKDLPLANGTAPSSYWIGHATLMIRKPIVCSDGSYSAVNILTDPIEGDIQKHLYPRYTNPACKVEDAPLPHVILISHNHRDHLSPETLKKLVKHQPVMIVPQGDGKKLRDLGFKHVQETSWWETSTISFKQGDKQFDLKISTVPAHHWSGQGAFDAHHALFGGYVIHGNKKEGDFYSEGEGDLYIAGDTAKLNDNHLETLLTRFDIRHMFQPGGPDENRKDMKSSHQSSADGLLMHFKIVLKNLYEKSCKDKTKAEFLQQAKLLKTVYMHNKAYKLGNIYFDDTDASVARVKAAFATRDVTQLKSYEREVFDDIMAVSEGFVFNGEPGLTTQEIFELLEASIVLPKIGERTDF